MINKGLSKVAVFFLYLLSLLPLPLLYILSDLIFYVIYHMMKYRRAVVEENLKKSFPHKTDEELKFIEIKFFSYLADLVVETIKMISISKQEVIKRYQINNPEVIERFFAEGRSVIGAVGHYGNWEWAAFSMSLLTPREKAIVYKPMSNAYFNEFFRRTRSKFGATLIPMKGTLRYMAQAKGRVVFSMFASDQTPVRTETQYWADFLHQPTGVFLGIEKLAKSFNNPVVFCDIRVLKRGYYSCDFKVITEEPNQTEEHEITNAHLHLLEQRINAEPAYWLWSHKRWKYKPKLPNE